MRRAEATRAVAVSAFVLLVGVGPSASTSRGDDATADATATSFERFRAGWKAQKGYMREVGDSGWNTRMSVLCAMARDVDSSVVVLQPALGDESAAVRIFAAQALGLIAGASDPDRSLVSRLETSLSTDPEAAVRLYAADALGKLGKLDASSRLVALERSDPNGDVRKHVRFALERKGATLSPDLRRALAEFDLTKIDTAKMGKPAPDFELVSAFGQRHRLSDHRGKRPVVIVFIYGDT